MLSQLYDHERKIPNISRARRRCESSDFAVNLRTLASPTLKNLLTEFGFCSLIEERKEEFVENLFGIYTFPTSYLVDSKGRILRAHIG